jgi:hypothetical protein
MADVVSQTHKDRLSQRNSEPTHIDGVPYEEIGGPHVDSEPSGPDYELDPEDGLTADTTIPKSVPAEKTHLGRVTGSDAATEADNVDVEFDELAGGAADAGSDDIDEALDRFEEVEPIDVDVEVDPDDDDDKDKKEVNEEDDEDASEDGKGKFPAFLKKESVSNFGGKKAKPFGKKGKRVTEDADIPDADNSDSTERGDNAAAMAASFNKPEADMNSGPNDVKEDDENPFAKKDDDDDDENPFAKKKDLEEDDASPEVSDLGKVEADAKEPAAAMDKKVTESVRVRIKLPNAKLFESAGVPKKNQRQVALVFESVVKNVTKQISTQVARHYRKLHEAKIVKRDQVLAKQMDSYLNYVVEEWIKSNKVAIRSSLRSQLAEEFLNGLHRLFSEHYIDVPQSKVDVVKTLSRQVDLLKKSLNEQVSQKMKLRRLAEAANKARHVAQFARTRKLSEAQTAKLDKLAENTQYVTAKDFRDKLGMLTETYFPSNKQLRHLPEETVQDAPKSNDKRSGDPVVAAAMAASRTLSDKDAW